MRLKAGVPPCAQVDPDKAFAVQMTLEESVLQEPVAYIQCALLYTSSNGERRIRWAFGPAAQVNGRALHATNQQPLLQLSGML